MHSTDDYLDPYRRSVQQHGPSAFDSTLWASEKSQHKRFEVFTQMCPFQNKRVLDAGCGRGDLAAFLLEQKHQEFTSYMGLDGLPEVITFARTRRMARCSFECGDFVREPKLFQLGDPEIICICGALNTMPIKMVFDVLDHAWSATEWVLIFNFLSDRAGSSAPPQSGPAFRLDTMALLDWAFSRSTRIAFRQDYFKHGHDATILMRKAE